MSQTAGNRNRFPRNPKTDGDHAWRGGARQRAPMIEEPNSPETSEHGTREEAAFVYYHRLRRVKEHVEQALADDISLESAARVAGLEAKYFSSYFRRKTGRCFKHWLAERRIEKAMHMMRACDYTIAQVAFSVGFRDLRTFERTFKKCTGITPRAYRDSVRPA